MKGFRLSAIETKFTISGTNEQITLEDAVAIVAGYTGRDAGAVQEHIDELAAIGIAPPPTVPMFYPVDIAAVTADSTITVRGERTSGEVEPLYIRCDGRYFLGISSDHTDREVEADDIADSKKACPKPVGRTVVEIADIDALDLDSARAISYVDEQVYQDGELSSLRRPGEVVRLFLENTDVGDRDFVCLGGTVPVKNGSFVYGDKWRIRLDLASGQTLEHEYSVQKGK